MKCFVWFGLCCVMASANASFQDCMDKLHMEGDADQKTILYTETSIAKSKGANNPPAPQKVEKIQLLSPSGTTTLKPGTNGCESSGKTNVYDFIAKHINNTHFAQGSGEPPLSQEALKEKLRSACRGIDPYLDQLLSSTHQENQRKQSTTK